MATEPAARPTPTLHRDKQHELYRRALKTLPGGTDSNFRAWGESTIYVDRGQGGEVWDIDGNRFVDLRMGYGPVILGHNDERVDDYVNERMRKGVSFSLTSEDEVRAMELVKELTGWVDKARMTVSGTEATMHAMRIARAYTGREKIVKFEGQYHGVHDYALISVGPDDMSELGDADAPVALAWGRGIPGAVADTIIPARYNRIDRLRTLFERARRGDRRDHRRAGPRQRPGDHARARLPQGDAGPDRGVRHPPDLRRGQDRLPLRQAAARPSSSASSRTSARSPRRWATAIRPPRSVDARRSWPCCRTTSATAARTPATASPRRPRSRPSRSCATRTPWRRSTPPGRRIQDGLREILNPVGIPYHFTGHPSMFGIMFREEVATEYRDWATTDHELYDAIAIGMHARGAMPEPDSREPWFVCEAHAKGDIVDRVLTAFEDSLAGGPRGARPRWRAASIPHGGMASPVGRGWSGSNDGRLTATRSARSIGRPPCSWPSATPRARPG